MVLLFYAGSVPWDPELHHGGFLHVHGGTDARICRQDCHHPGRLQIAANQIKFLCCIRLKV